MSPIIEIPADENIKSAYMKMYALENEQYDLLEQFFITFRSSNSFLNTEMIETVFLNCVEKRNGEISLAKKDISRMIYLMDQDRDGYISFNEFIELLNLSLAKESNIALRINQFITNRTYFYDLNDLNIVHPREGAIFLNFFNIFYSPHHTQLIEAYKMHFKSKKSFSLRNVLHLKEKAYLCYEHKLEKYVISRDSFVRI